MNDEHMSMEIHRYCGLKVQGVWHLYLDLGSNHYEVFGLSDPPQFPSVVHRFSQVLPEGKAGELPDDPVEEEIWRGLAPVPSEEMTVLRHAESGTGQSDPQGARVVACFKCNASRRITVDQFASIVTEAYLDEKNFGKREHRLRVQYLSDFQSTNQEVGLSWIFRVLDVLVGQGIISGEEIKLVFKYVAAKAEHNPDLIKLPHNWEDIQRRQQDKPLR